MPKPPPDQLGYETSSKSGIALPQTLAGGIGETLDPRSTERSLRLSAPRSGGSATAHAESRVPGLALRRYPPKRTAAMNVANSVGNRARSWRPAKLGIDAPARRGERLAKSRPRPSQVWKTLAIVPTTSGDTGFFWGQCRSAQLPLPEITIWCAASPAPLPAISPKVGACQCSLLQPSALNSVRCSDKRRMPPNHSV
jgi:hypothetical protein